jgi:hypothetical protein
MKKAKSDKEFYFLLFVIAVFLAAVLTAATIILLANSVYVPMIVIGIIAGAAYYAATFLFFLYDDAKRALRVIAAAGELGSYDCDALAAKLAWKCGAMNKFLKKCKKRKYIR